MAPAGAKVPGCHVAFFYLAPRTSVAESIAERFRGLFTGRGRKGVICALNGLFDYVCTFTILSFFLCCFQPPNAKMYCSPVQCKGTEVEALLVLPPRIFQPSPSRLQDVCQREPQILRKWCGSSAKNIPCSPNQRYLCVVMVPRVLFILLNTSRSVPPILSRITENIMTKPGVPNRIIRVIHPSEHLPRRPPHPTLSRYHRKHRQIPGCQIVAPGCSWHLGVPNRIIQT